MRQCSNCKFFIRSHPTHCRLMPPTALDNNNSTFPLVRPEFWCAQHRFSLRAILRMIFRLGRPKE